MSDVEAEFRAFVAKQPTVILGSISRSRTNIMNELSAEYGLKYRVFVAPINEKLIRHPDPASLVTSLSLAKAAATREKLLRREPEATGLLITGDQVVVCQGEILEKPLDADQAADFLRRYRSHPAQTVGAVACTDVRSGRQAHRVAVASVHFSEMSEETVLSLVEEAAVMWCSGALMVEHPLVWPNVRLEGAIDNVQGLDKATLKRLLLDMAAEGLPRVDALSIQE